MAANDPFFLPNSVFATNKRQDSFMSTTYLDACIQALKEANEYPTDELLIHLVEIQKLAQSISFTLDVSNGGSFLGGSLQQLPITMVIDSFQEQLDNFKASLPMKYRENREYFIQQS